VIIFIVAFFGCCGAWRESSCMVYTYAALLTIILIGKLSAIAPSVADPDPYVFGPPGSGYISQRSGSSSKTSKKK
jgi:hypothetical protein